jgi:hypothetical protein
MNSPSTQGGIVAEALPIVVELNEMARRILEHALADVTDDEIDWRVVPAANSVNVIVRHLRIESEWQLRSLVHGDPMRPARPAPAVQARIDAVPLDFRRNLAELRECLTRFVDTLRSMTPEQLEERTLQAYGADVIAKADRASDVRHLLGYHQALHVASHAGQIRSIRNLFAKTRGEAPRFFPENATYPAAQS